MRIVLLGDVHLYRLAVRPWQLLSKRLLGQLNLWLNRRSRFDPGLLPALLERVRSLAPDLLLCTGDLTTTAMPSEFELARELLGPAFGRQTTFIVPGNHDRYTFTAMRRRYLERHFAGHTAGDWPHHRPLSETWRLIAVDAARPTLLFAGGALPQAQLDRLGKMLRDIDASQRLIVMGHYPLGTPGGHRPEPRMHRLRHADELLAALREAGHEMLYLHGHVHEPWCWRPEAAANVVAINAGAPLMRSERWPAGQGFWRIELAGGAYRLTHEAMDRGGAWRAAPIDPLAAGGGVAAVGSPSER